MRKQIIKKIAKEMGNVEIVTTISEEPVDMEIDSEFILDARSAAFYALGQAMKTKKKIVLLIRGEELTSAYTAITEAWFHKVDIIVLAEYTNSKELKCDYLKRCTKAIFNIEEVDDIQILNKNYGPILFNYIEYEKNEQVNFNEFADTLKALKMNKVIVYNGKLESDIEIQQIERKYKYGLLSKYIGYINSVDDRIALLCDAENVLCDLNIFNTRYMKKNFKVFVIDEKGKLESKNIDKWIISNGIEYVDDLQKIDINKPTVYVKKGR